MVDNGSTLNSDLKGFMKRSVEIVENFLLTVVLVDDQAEFGDIGCEESNEPLEPPKKLIEPSRASMSQNTKKEDNANLESYLVKSTNKLDAKKIVDSFALKGIICSVIKPVPEEDRSEMVKKICNVAKRADVLILDWKLDNDESYSVEIIEKILESDLKENSRLRLIIVYTGEPNLTSTLESIAKKIRRDPDTINVDNDNFIISFKHTRIVIFAKEGSLIPQPHKFKIVNEEKLPERVTLEFANITTGLVSNVALESLSVLRSNTPSILSELSPEIDSSFLAHRALLPYPDDAMDHITDIIASEFHSVLESYEVGKKADLDSIVDWLNFKNEKGTYKMHHIRIVDDETKILEISVDHKKIVKIMRKGFDKVCAEIKYSIGDKQDHIRSDSFRNLTETFCFNNECAFDVDCKFAILASQKNYYSKYGKSPSLTLGTILKEDSPEDHFWLCVQPRCDCVRVKNERNFVFLPLNKVDDENAFDIVVKEGSNYSKLKIDYKNYHAKHLHFSSNNSPDKMVRAYNEKDSFYFSTFDEKPIKFKWISELKSEQAQRISNNFATQLSRVGLNESEWQRRWAGFDNSDQLNRAECDLDS